MSSDCLPTSEGASSAKYVTSPNLTHQAEGTSRWGKPEVGSQWPSRKGDSLPNITCESNLYHLKTRSNAIQTTLPAEHQKNFPLTSSTVFTKYKAEPPFELQTHMSAKLGSFSSSDILASDLSTPSSSIIAPSKVVKRLGYPLSDLSGGDGVGDGEMPLLQMTKPVVADSGTRITDAWDGVGEVGSSEDGVVSSSEDGDDISDKFPSSMEESFHELPDCPTFPHCDMKHAAFAEEKSCDSTCSASLTDIKTPYSGNDSGYGLCEDFSTSGSPQNDLERSCRTDPGSNYFLRGCQHRDSAIAYLNKELQKMKRESEEKDAALASLREALKKQCVEKEDILVQKIKSDIDLRACEQQLETTRKSETRYRTNFYQNTAEVNALQREVISLQGEVTSRKIYANKLHAEIMQSNNMPNRNHCCASMEKEQTLKSCLEEVKTRQDQDFEQTVLLLEKKVEHLQDELEDMRFKSKRFAEEAASLGSQNSQLVKQCGDLQRQLVECLTTISLLDVRCNDAESRLKRTHVALEEKEDYLCQMSSERTAALLKIEENKRELETVRSEMANVTRNFMKLSDNQRDLKERLFHCKKIIDAKDIKIQRLSDERDSLLSRRKRQEEETFVQNQAGDLKIVNPSQPSIEHTNSYFDEQSKELQKSFGVVDVMLSQQITILKQENEGLASEVQALKDALNYRCANSISRTAQIIETIERLEEDMNDFLELKCEAVQGDTSALVSCLQAAGNGVNEELCQKANSEQESAQLMRENLELVQALMKTKLEVDVLRREINEMEDILNKQNIGNKAHEIDAKEVPKCSKQGTMDDVTIERTLDQKENRTFCDVETSEKLAERSLETKANLLEKANNELISYVEGLHKVLLGNQSFEKNTLEIPQHLRSISRDACNTVDAVSGPSIFSDGSTINELNRISVFLQICVLKTMSIVSKDAAQYECHLGIVSALKDLLLNVRSVISFEGDSGTVCKLIELPSYGAPEGEPNLLLASRTELEEQLADSRKNVQTLRKALAVSEEEKRREEQRHKSQLFDLVNKFSLRLKENVMKEAVKGDDENGGKTSLRSDHSVCTDMVVKLERDLRSCRQTIHKLRDEITTKNEETWRLHQEISTLRSDITVVHDILDNKKIALGRSEAIGQMLRVSQSSLEQRLGLEQRQHEDCRQQLDRTLEDTRATADENKDLRRQLVEKDGQLSAIHEQYGLLSQEHQELLCRCQEKDGESKLTPDKINAECCNGFRHQDHKMVTRGVNTDPGMSEKTIFPPPRINNEADLRALVERSGSPRPDLTGQLKQSVSHMAGDIHFLVGRLIKRGKDD